MLALARASPELRSGGRRATAGASTPEALAARLLEVIAAADELVAHPAPLPPLPPMNLGYAADNITLRRSHRVTTSRACHRRTFDAKGLEYVSRLALQNCLDLAHVVRWNHAAGVRLFRVSSQLFPWSGEYRLEELPDYEAIAAALAATGRAARACGQRLTTHPPHFVKLASPDAELARRSAAWLEVHSKVFDLMGYAPSHWNKVS
jgi:UV DNA damage endonuclease